jgi:hypothetical protein
MSGVQIEMTVRINRDQICKLLALLCHVKPDLCPLCCVVLRFDWTHRMNVPAQGHTIQLKYLIKFRIKCLGLKWPRSFIYAWQYIVKPRGATHGSGKCHRLIVNNSASYSGGPALVSRVSSLLYLLSQSIGSDSGSRVDTCRQTDRHDEPNHYNFSLGTHQKRNKWAPAVTCVAPRLAPAATALSVL